MLDEVRVFSEEKEFLPYGSSIKLVDDLVWFKELSKEEKECLVGYRINNYDPSKDDISILVSFEEEVQFNSKTIIVKEENRFNILEDYIKLGEDIDTSYLDKKLIKPLNLCRISNSSAFMSKFYYEDEEEVLGLISDLLISRGVSLEELYFLCCVVNDLNPSKRYSIESLLNIKSEDDFTKLILGFCNKCLNNFGELKSIFVN